MQSAMDYARREIGDALHQLLLRRPGPVRASLLVYALPRDLDVSPATVREVLETDPRFVFTDGRFDLSVRAELAGTSFNSAVARVITECGRPIRTEAIAALFAGATGRSTDYYTGLIRQLLDRADLFFAVNDHLLPASWVLLPEGDNEEDVLFFCDLDTDEELAALRPSLARDDLRGATPLDTAVSVVQAAPAPISNKVLGFFVYRLHPEEFDALVLLEAMLAEDRVYPTPGLRWTGGGVREAIRDALKELDSTCVAQRPTPSVDLEPLLAEPLPPEHPGYFIQDDDLETIYDVLHQSARPLSVADVLLGVLELAPGQQQFLAAAHSVHALLRDDPEVLQVGPISFAGRGGVPAWAREVPDILVPAPGKPGVDVILQEEGLRPGLADKVHDPFLEDVGEEDVTLDPSVMAEDETFYTLPFPHRVAGTMKLRKMDAAFFGVTAPVAPLEVLDAEGFTCQAWANTETGLVLGLDDLYARMDLMPGAVVAVTPGDRPGQFVFSHAGQDENASVDEGRLHTLLHLRERAEATETSVFDLTCELISAHSGGVAFERLLAELNVVRRTTRLQLASVLSYYQCFRPRDSKGDQWGYAPEAAHAGPVPTKLKYVAENG